MREIII